MDTLTVKERSKRMSLVRSKDTKPEMAVRRLTHGLGFRYRLHGKLPGRPDMVFTSRKKVIFVHGCFWHLHEGCQNNRPPKSRQEFWMPKLKANTERDHKNIEALKEMGWDVLVIWECQIKNTETLKTRIVEFLEG